MNTPAIKQCSACKAELPFSAFGRNRASPDGLHWYCRVCHSRKQRAWRQANPEKVSFMRMKYRYERAGKT
jgi:hypothetical protein